MKFNFRNYWKKLNLTIFTLILFSIYSEATATSQILTKIPEASGIDFCPNTQTLMVANDEGTLYEIDKNGNLLRKQKLGKHDFEGVVCHENEVVLATEKGALLVVDRKTYESKKYKLKSKKFKLSKKAGIEGITYHDGYYYLSIQAKKSEDAKLLKIEIDSKKAKVVEVIDHCIIDTAGLHYHNGILYMVSDKKNRLYLYDLKKQKVLQTIKLEKFNQEGVTIDDQGIFYFADDAGSVKRYTREELGWK